MSGDSVSKDDVVFDMYSFFLRERDVTVTYFLFSPFSVYIIGEKNGKERVCRLRAEWKTKKNKGKT